ncbi:hypothetical protein SAMN04244574_04403 [Azotobacter beijerinckii]|uniref:Uncharacterized protein n=1 Tax=Azotobacter beijerinckii TaxID=170623 RepID=A0A1I4HYH8_9GAMM|nr:hypothetical protein SAMN04244571_04489 [Azotobacter beijerinckii]SFL46950.1 hypothetical protein SAMN04244574_04403 [Azotobacter beijerinckii]
MDQCAPPAIGDRGFGEAAARKASSPARYPPRTARAAASPGFRHPAASPRHGPDLHQVDRLEKPEPGVAERGCATGPRCRIARDRRSICPPNASDGKTASARGMSTRLRRAPEMNRRQRGLTECPGSGRRQPPADPGSRGATDPRKRQPVACDIGRKPRIARRFAARLSNPGQFLSLSKTLGEPTLDAVMPPRELLLCLEITCRCPSG